MPSRSRPAVLAVLATAVLLTSAVAGAAPVSTDVQDDETPDGEDVIETMRDRIESLDTVEFTRTMESTYDGQTTTRTVRVAADLNDFQKRVETVNSSFGGNTTTVVNESTRVTYDADDNTVSEYETYSDTLLQMVEPLTNESLVSYEFAGTETVDGEETYVLEGTPEQTGQVEGDASLTVYIDTETYFPRKVVSEQTAEDYESSVTMTYENVTLNEELPDSTFELDVPDDATEPSHPGPEITSYDSYDALAGNVSETLPDADLADGFSFEGGSVIEGDSYSSVHLSYADGENHVSVSVRTETAHGFDYDDSEMYEPVEIGNATGYLYDSERYTMLHVEDDQRYSLYGAVSNETAVTVAESIVDG